MNKKKRGYGFIPKLNKTEKIRTLGVLCFFFVCLSTFLLAYAIQLEANYKHIYKNNMILHEKYSLIPSDILILNDLLYDFNNTYIEKERTCTHLSYYLQDNLLTHSIETELYCINNTELDIPNHALLKTNLYIDPTFKTIYMSNDRHVPCADIYNLHYDMLLKFYNKYNNVEVGKPINQ